MTVVFLARLTETTVVFLARLTETTVVFLARLTENGKDNKKQQPVRQTGYSSLSSKSKKILSG